VLAFSRKHLPIAILLASTALCCLRSLPRISLRMKKSVQNRADQARGSGRLRVESAKSDAGEEHLRRVRRICAALPETTEKLSHGEPTFFVRKKVYVMFANNHHNDGHIAVWIPVPEGMQPMLLRTEPQKFFLPPYVGVRGWVGIELDRIDDENLALHLCEAWRLIAPKKLQTAAAGR